MQLTDEQAAVVNAFGTRQHLRLVAYAGAGKTSTLRAVTNYHPHSRFMYLAFNKAIASEASGKFRYGVECRTAHSLAYRTVAAMGFSDEKLRSSFNTRSLNGHVFSPLDLISTFAFKQLVSGTIRRFCQSADMEITSEHVPQPLKYREMADRSDEASKIKPVVQLPPGVDTYEDNIPNVKRRVKSDWEEIEEAVVQSAKQVYRRMTSSNDAMPLGHDGYLKVFQTSMPHILADAILVDEAQDLNPVLIDIIARQAGHAQIISVGDSHQQIYAWRGAVDALKRLPGLEMRLTQSFRFGGQIASFANDLLAAMGENVPLRGNPALDGFVERTDGVPDAILCRTNAGVIETLDRYIDDIKSIHVVGGTGEMSSLIQDVERLLNYQEAITSDLLGFTSWEEVVEFSKTDDGMSLRSLCNLVDVYGTDKLKALLSRTVPLNSAHLTISTAHKSKGMEWSDVELHNDFFVNESDKGIPMAERRLFYVASTRAQRCLSVDSYTSEAYRRLNNG